jgi:thiamine biosynthesis lipoprotein
MDILASVCRSQPLLGTFVEIRSLGTTRFAAERAIDAAFATVAEVHRLMSFHDSDSDISRLNREAYKRSLEVDPWTYGVLETALNLHRQSAGVFDITVASALQKLGLLPCNGDNIDSQPTKRATSSAIELLSGNRVRFHHPGTRIDLGGIAKGFAVDRAIDVLRQHNQTHGLVNAGGDLATFGLPPEEIHIRDPRFPSEMFCRLEIADTALATSGRLFNPFHSLDCHGSPAVDPSTQEPVTEIAGATVRAQSCAIADALTKIAMIIGEQAATLLAKYQAGALLVLASGEARVTPEFQDGFRATA